MYKYNLEIIYCFEFLDMAGKGKKSIFKAAAPVKQFFDLEAKEGGREEATGDWEQLSLDQLLQEEEFKTLALEAKQVRKACKRTQLLTS